MELQRAIMPSMKPITQWTREGWHFLLPSGETHYAHGVWYYVANVGGNAIPEGYYRSYKHGGYFNMEDHGPGTWFGPLEELKGRVS